MLRDDSLIDASGLRRTSALVLTCPAKDLVPHIRCIGASSSGTT